MTSREMDRKPQKTAAQMREEERAKWSNIDRMLISNARLSPVEMAQKVGITPEEAAARLAHILKSRDFLTDRQEERLLIIEMGDLIDEMRNRMSAAGDQFFGDIAAVTLRGYEAIAKRIDARRKVTELDISEITRAQGEMFLAIMMESVNLVATRLEELHPDLDFDVRAEIEEGFAIALPEAQSSINKRVRD